MIKRIVAVLILIFLALLVFIGSPFGLRAAITLAADQGIIISNASGSLLHRIILSGIKVKQNSIDANIKTATLQWQPLDLLLGNIAIKQLSLNHSDITIKPTQRASSASQKKWLSIGIKLHQLSITDSHIHYQHKQYTIKTLSAKAQINNKAINATLSVQGDFPQKTSAYINIHGPWQNYQLKFNLSMPNINLHATGQGNLSQLQLQLNHAHNHKNTVSGIIDLSWQPKIHINTDLTITNLPIRQELISGNILARYDSLHQFTVQTKLHSKHGYISIHGGLKKNWNLHWDINIHALNDYVTRYSGRINSKGSITGTTLDPRLIGTINSKTLNINQYHIGALQGKWRLSLDNINRSSASLDAENIFVGTHAINNIALHLAGTLKKHQLVTSISTPDWQSQGKAIGSFNPTTQQWHGQLTQLTFHAHSLKHWQLQKPVRITASSQQWQLQQLCLTNNKAGNLCIQGSQKNQHWQTQLSSTLHLGAFEWLRQNNAQLTGTLTTQITLAGNNSAISRISSQSLLAHGAIIINNKQRTTIKTLKATVVLKNHHASQDLDIVLAHGAHIRLSTQAEHLVLNQANINPTLTGSLDINLPTLTAINAFLPTLWQLSGTAHSHIQLSGTLEQPHINGSLQLKPSELKLPQIGLHITNATLTLKSTKQQIDYQLQLDTNHQPITLKGHTDLNQNFRSDASITGMNLAIMNTVDYQIFASPKLKLHFRNNRLHIDGSATIPKANLTPQNFTSTHTIPRSDIEFVRDTHNTKKSLQLFINVAIKLGKDIHINSHGVIGNVRGQLQVTQKPNQPLVANGKLALINARYDAHGQKLTIERGTFNYAQSPISNPNINITAVRHFNNYSNNGLNSINGNLAVGLNITGNLSRPKISLFSRPATLSQADILSYLLLGHGSNGGTSANAALLLQALNTVGSKDGIGGLTEKLQSGLGLNEFGVETQANLDAAGNPINSQSAFVVGKYITPKIYLRYSMGLSDSVSTVQMRYYFNHNWSVQTENSTLGNGGDILYSFSRD